MVCSVLHLHSRAQGSKERRRRGRRENKRFVNVPTLVLPKLRTMKISKRSEQNIIKFMKI